MNILNRLFGSKTTADEDKETLGRVKSGYVGDEYFRTLEEELHEAEAEDITHPPTDDQVEWEKVVKLYPTGSTIRYLGVDMTVVLSSEGYEYVRYFSFIGTRRYWMSRSIRTQYVDKTGSIKQYEIHKGIMQFIEK
jgi:hypothetical protein